ncbi:MAG: glycosyltransferase family 9 protein [Bacteriovoracia bacterium]
MQSILVRAPNWIGDQVMAYPFFYYLRRAFPRAHIATISAPWVESVQFRRQVDEVISLPRPLRPTVWSRFQNIHAFGAELRGRRKWDLAISLPNSFSAAWLLRRAGAATRRGYRLEGRGWLLNDSLPWDPSPGLHRAQAYLNLLPKGARAAVPGMKGAEDFWGVYPENPLDEKIAGELEAFDAMAEWAPKETLAPPAGPYWVLAPGATAESRRWPLNQYIQLARMVHQETGWPGIVVGGPAEAAMAAEMEEDKSLHVRDFTARGPVSGLWKIFREARFTVCNESGLAHVASLCGSRVRIVCGAANPARTEPIGPGQVAVCINPVECWPCEKNECYQPPQKKLQCLKGIEVQRVWEEIKVQLKDEYHA